MLFRILLYLINPVLPLAIYIISCNTKRNEDTVYAPKEAQEKYAAVKKTIKTKKQNFITTITTANFNKEQVANQYINLFVNEMVPAWKGTPWKFTGTTTTPHIGTIACGYFVTTTLQDMQFPIDRLKYAQCASQETLQHLAKPEHVKILNNLSFEQFIKLHETKKDFIGVVGLDNHIGYLVKKDKSLNFIHSGVRTNGVAIENAKSCSDLKNSKWRSIAYITEDTFFLKKWIAYK